MIIGCISPLNIGFLAIAFAYSVGVLYGGLKVSELLLGFPVSLFVTVVGVSYLFALVEVNGTLEKLTRYIIRSTGGKAMYLPIGYFLIAFALSSIGPGPIPITALLTTPALAAAGKLGIKPLLMILMVIHGAIAGSLSPVAVNGVVANSIVAKLGFSDMSIKIYLNTIFASSIVAAIAFLLLGGLQLSKKKSSVSGTEAGDYGLSRNHVLTLAGIGFLLFSIIFLKWDVGLTALATGVVLSFLNPRDEAKAIRAVSWGTILMVTGVFILVELMTKLGGTELLASAIAGVSTPGTIALTFSFAAALLSVYASTVAVVYPAFLPLVPSVVSKIGGGDPMAIISCLVTAACLVDASPLSTLGALALAATPDKANQNKLFRNLLVWGLSMSVVGSVVSWLLFSVLHLP